MPALTTQATLVVDAAGGPGTFATLQAAEQAASSGDVIEVLPTGHYDFTLTTSKGLTIVGVGTTAVSFHGVLEVNAVPANHTFVFRRCWAAQSGLPLTGAVRVVDCGGVVAFEEVLLFGEPSGASFRPGLEVLRCGHVAVHTSYCSGGPALSATDSLVAVSQTTLNGFFGTPLGIPVPGVAVTALNTVLHLTECTTSGGSTSLLANPRTAIELSQSSLHVAGGHLIGGSEPPLQAPAVTFFAGSTMTIDSAVVVIGGYVGGTPGPYESGRVAFVGAAPGQATHAVLSGPSLSFGVLALALPGVVSSTPYGLLWADDQNFVVLHAALLPFQVPITIPAVGTPRHVLLTQGVLFHQGACRLSNPVHAVVR